MTRHLGFAPLPSSGGNAGDIELSGWTRATDEDVRRADQDARMEEMRAKVRGGYWDTSVECFLVQLEKDDAAEAAGKPADTVTIHGPLLRREHIADEDRVLVRRRGRCDLPSGWPDRARWDAEA
jgi:hypothetical protein